MREQTAKLEDDEVLYKVNERTSEMKEIKVKPNNLKDTGKEKFDFDASFNKAYERSWMYLAKELSPQELKIALMMSCMTEFSTNSLAPLDNSTQMQYLSELFGVGINQIKTYLKHLLKKGVYATFTYGHYKRGEVTEWVFNPFISFKGSLIDSDLKNLFLKTQVAKHFYNVDM